MYLVDITNQIELALPNVQTVLMNAVREVIKATSQATNMPIVVAGGTYPRQIIVTYLIISDIENHKKKANYFNGSGIETLLISPNRGMGFVGYVESIDLPDTVEQIDIITATAAFVAKGVVLGYAKEAENITLTGCTASADADASNAQKVGLDAQNDCADFSITQSAWALPLGNYRLYCRAKDSAQVASDLGVSVYNTTDAASVATGNKTCTASYAWYSLDFTIAAGQSGDAIRFRALKSTATANTISVDLLAVAMI